MIKIERLKYLLVALAVAQVQISSLSAKEIKVQGEPFHFIKSYRDVKSDPDQIWTGDDLAPRSNGTVSIFEYELKSDNGKYVVSQIWNDNCSLSVCPTRLLKIGDDGSKKTLVDDMMHQVIPDDDQKFASFVADPKTKAYALSPFLLSKDGKKFINSDYKFDIGG